MPETTTSPTAEPPRVKTRGIRRIAELPLPAVNADGYTRPDGLGTESWIGACYGNVSIATNGYCRTVDPATALEIAADLTAAALDALTAQSGR